ncbi:LAGLIDADG family homing endonuclease [Marinoscillum luteum]|uniref:LAGLIDADG family homing endonuclease n=1 Tax=Marinoscillum luteum TaxID=861051 RepID=A0ABW7NE07_9BACT
MNWSYISGFFDADGSIQLNRIHRNQLPSPVMTFHNNERVILELIKAFIYDELNVNGTIVTKKKEGYADQFELRYSYFSKFKAIVGELVIHHPRKLKRIEFIQKYQGLSKRNGKYSNQELETIALLLKQWE